MASAYDIEAGVPSRALGPYSSSSSSQPRPGRPLDNENNSQRRPRHDGLYTRIIEDRRASGQGPSPYDEFYGNDDIEKVTVKGYPSIAAFHTKYANTRVCRAFAAVTQRLMTTYQCQITCLLGALVELDVEEASTSRTSGAKGTQAAPFDKEEFIYRCLRSPDQMSLIRSPTKDAGSDEDAKQRKERIGAGRENLIANMERIFDKYRSLVTWQNALRNFPPVSANTHEGLFEYIKNMDGLDPDVIDYLRDTDDLIYAEADPLYQRFHTFLTYARGAIVKIVKYLSCKTIFASEDVAFGRGAYSEKKIRLFVKSVMVLAGSTLLLTPVGILYLGKTYKGTAFLVITLFSLAFAFTLVAFADRMLHVLLGLAAYVAVLVSAFDLCD